MTDEEKKVADAAKEAADAAKKLEDSSKSKLKELSTDELIDIIHDTRNEAKQRRLKEKELNERLEAIEAEKSTQEQAKLIAEGKKDEVILDLQQKLKKKDEDFKPFIDKAQKYDDYDSSKRGKLKEVLTNDWLESFNSMPLIELEELASKLNSNVKLLDTDDGKGKKKVGKEFFTLEELKTLTPKELADKDILEKANRSLEFHSKK